MALELSAHAMMVAIRAVLSDRARLMQTLERMDDDDPDTEELGEAVMEIDKVMGELRDVYDEAIQRESGYPDISELKEIADRLV